METVYVLGMPYTASFGGAHNTMAECEREQARGVPIVKDQKFKILENKCDKRRVGRQRQV